MKQHTPGEWRVHRGDGSNVYIVTSKENEWIINFMQRGLEITQETLANARLIAAAPDLLKALQAMMREYKALTYGGDNRWPVASRMAIVAIEKATGETK